MTSILDYIVERVIEAYNASINIILEARKPLIDTLGVMAASPRVYPKSLKIAASIAGDNGNVRLFGTSIKSSSRGTAIAGAFLSHSIEFDDWLAPGYVHAGSIIIPIILSYGYNKTLGEALRVIAAGYEAGLVAGSYYGGSHYRYWHSTSTIGGIVAATTYTLLVEGPSEKALKSSISLAATYMGGLWLVNNARALYKPLSPAQAVQTGILAGRAGIVEGRMVPHALEESCRIMHGYCKLVEHDRHGLLLNGYKFYPTCRHSHTIIEAAEQLYGRIPLKDILSIKAILFQEAYNIAGKRDPQTVEEARFSIPFLVSATLKYGRIDFETLKQFNNPAIKELMEKVELESSPEYTRAYPIKQPAKLVIETRRGTLTSYIEYPKGDPERPIELEDLINKLEGLREYIPSRDYEAIINIPGMGLDDRINDILGIVG